VLGIATLYANLRVKYCVQPLPWVVRFTQDIWDLHMSISTCFAVEIREQGRWRSIDAEPRLPCTKDFRRFLEDVVPASQTYVGITGFPADADAESLLRIMASTAYPSNLEGVEQLIKWSVNSFGSEAEAYLAEAATLSRQERIAGCWRIWGTEFYGRCWLLLSDLLAFDREDKLIPMYGKEQSFVELMGAACVGDLRALKHIGHPDAIRFLICFC